VSWFPIYLAFLSFPLCLAGSLFLSPSKFLLYLPTPFLFCPYTYHLNLDLLTFGSC
jgi:hypothetical protein